MQLNTESKAPDPVRSYRYYDMMMAGFVTVLLCSNLIGPGKVCFLFGITFSAGNLFFPISYIFGDVMTEVYGYARARKVIWTGFISMIFATIMGYVVIHTPLAPDEPYNGVLQPALEIIFGNTWRIVAGSILAFWVGDFANSFVMARLKVLTQGRHLWMRTISSTMVGQFCDSIIFYPLAFWGLWTVDQLYAVILFNFAIKVAIEVIMTPATYLIVNFLKRAENEDYYDYNTNFTPFSLKT